MEENKEKQRIVQPRYRNCQECNAYIKLKNIEARVNAVPKLSSSIDYKTCLDDIKAIIHKSLEEKL